MPADRISWPEVFGQEAWDNVLEDCIEQAAWMGAADVREIAALLSDALDALVEQGALRESVRRSVDASPDLRQYVSVWREVTE